MLKTFIADKHRRSLQNNFTPQSAAKLSDEAVNSSQALQAGRSFPFGPLVPALATSLHRFLSTHSVRSAV